MIWVRPAQTGWPNKASTRLIDNPPLRLLTRKKRGNHTMHPVVLKSTKLILAGDIAGAENALVAIAEQEGDHALVSVLDEMPPKDLLAVMREFDSSRESVVNMLVTPEQFSRAIVLERKYGERTSERLRAMMNAIIFRDSASVTDYLEALAESEGGSQTLADYFEDRYEELCGFVSTGTFAAHFDMEDGQRALNAWQAENNEAHDEEQGFGNAIEDDRPKLSRAEVADGDWMETAWVLRYELNDAFEDVMFVLRSRAQKQMQEAMATPKPAAASSSPLAEDDDEESAI
jgi:hypothetical protein